MRAFGAWARAELELGGGFDLIGGLRWDWVEFVAGDRFTSNGDASDRLHFRELSPQLGLHWGRSTALQLYANLGSAFRVPTTTELAGHRRRWRTCRAGSRTTSRPSGRSASSWAPRA